MKNTNPHWDGDQYSKNSKPQYEASMAMLDHNYKFKGDEEVLDVGCGDGKITFQIAQYVPRGRVVGVDNSPNMVQFAQKTYAEQKNLTFEVRDAQDLGPIGEFDLIVSNFCLQWAPNKILAFKEIKKHLKPDGRLILIVPFRNQTIAKLREQMAKEDHWKEYFSGYFDPSIHVEDTLYRKYAEIAGLAISSYTTAPVTTYFKDSKSLADFLSIITPHLVRLPDENKKTQFTDELVRRYLEIVPKAADGACKITYVYAQMCAKRPAFTFINIMGLDKKNSPKPRPDTMDTEEDTFNIQSKL